MVNLDKSEVLVGIGRCAPVIYIDLAPRRIGLTDRYSGQLNIAVSPNRDRHVISSPRAR